MMKRPRRCFGDSSVEEEQKKNSRPAAAAAATTCAHRPQMIIDPTRQLLPAGRPDLFSLLAMCR